MKSPAIRRGALALGASLCFCAVSAADVYDDLGTLVEGVECTLFQADSGELFIVDDFAEFGPGDRVRVMGDLDRTCASVCMQGAGCVQNSQVYDATDFSAACGTLISRNGCAVLETDDGQVWALDETFPFQVGDYVHVVGTYNAECGGSCSVGIACLRTNTVYDGADYCTSVISPTPDDPNDPDQPNEPDDPEDPDEPDDPNQSVEPTPLNLCGFGSLSFLLQTLLGLTIVRLFARR